MPEGPKSCAGLISCLSLWGCDIHWVPTHAPALDTTKALWDHATLARPSSRRFGGGKSKGIWALLATDLALRLIFQSAEELQLGWGLGLQTLFLCFAFHVP